MTTIMTVGDSEGERRCDGTCHNATKPRCSCICRGRYHGAGEQAAAIHQQDVLGGVYGEEVAEAAKAPLEGQAIFGEAGS